MVVERPPFEPSTIPPQVSWARAGVMPPAPLYIHRDDALNIESWGSVAGANLIIRARLLLPNGTMTQLTFNHTPSTDRSRGSTDHEMTEGWLLSLIIEDSAGGARRGQVWVRANLVRGPGATALLMQTLCEGYAGAFMPVWWPPGRQVGSIEGRGGIRVINGTDPAAGANVVETVPTNALWRLLSFRASLVTGAAVANRRVSLETTGGGGEQVTVIAASDQLASLTRRYNFAPVGVDEDLRLTVYLCPLPDPFLLTQGTVITVAASAMQAADDWTNVRYVVEEWIEE